MHGTGDASGETLLVFLGGVFSKEKRSFLYDVRQFWDESAFMQSRVWSQRESWGNFPPVLERSNGIVEEKRDERGGDINPIS